MAGETLFFFGMTIPDDICVTAARACWSARQLLARGGDTKHKIDDPLDIRVIKGFEAVKLSSNSISHMIIALYCIGNHMIQL